MTNEGHLISVYQCPECHKRFGSASELQLHEHICMSRHTETTRAGSVSPVTGEKPSHVG